MSSNLNVPTLFFLIELGIKKGKKSSVVPTTTGWSLKKYQNSQREANRQKQRHVL